MVEVLPASRACRPSSLCVLHIGPVGPMSMSQDLDVYVPGQIRRYLQLIFSSPDGTSGGGGNDDNNNSQPFHSHKFVN